MRLILLVIFFFPYSASSQSFVYSFKKDGTATFISGSDSIVFHKGIKTKEAYMERIVKVNGVNYKLYRPRTKEKFLGIRDAQGKRQAHILLATEERFCIFLQDGRRLDWVPGRRKEWSYQLDGKDVLKAKYVKERGIGKIVLTDVEQNVVTPTVLIACMQYGENVMFTKGRVVLFFAIGVFVAITRAASPN